MNQWHPNEFNKRGKTNDLKLKVDFISGRANLTTFSFKNEESKGALCHHYFPR